MKTYREMFPDGARVVVEAGPAEGTDHEFNGRTGTVRHAQGGWITVQIDRPPPYWRNPAILCPHNLRRIDHRQGKEG
jgi:ribosomal protein L21E